MRTDATWESELRIRGRPLRGPGPGSPPRTRARRRPALPRPPLPRPVGSKTVRRSAHGEYGARPEQQHRAQRERGRRAQGAHRGGRCRPCDPGLVWGCGCVSQFSSGPVRSSPAYCTRYICTGERYAGHRDDAFSAIFFVTEGKNAKKRRFTLDVTGPK